MKTFLVIGAGNFGHHLCRELAKQRCEVMLVDNNEHEMEDLLKLVTSARIADCTDKAALASLDIPSYDACFVCVGRNFQISLEVTDLLRELKAKKIYSKADEDIQAKFLKRAGADYVIYPEQETARRIAVSESSDSIFDLMPLTDDYGIYEIQPHSTWIGKSIRELNIRNVHNIS
ncbi:MAG: TrkA family potassium uptake protein, partial [Oscillospiraceae bacterium]|nr:TrkA family potassium uptake protein [Oscillospiraceae bacterium]